jgi:vesicle-associated membrane protein 7
MSFVYTLVSRGKTVLAENTGAANASGNFEVIARMVLSKLEDPNQPPRRSVDTENHTFHILNDGGLFFVVLAERDVSSRSAFGFLMEVKQRFTTAYKRNEWEQAIAHSFDAEFSGALSALMAKYNESPEKLREGGDQCVQRVNEQLDEVRDVIKMNIESLLNRGERIELLVDTTERLSHASIKFQESATRLKNQYWWQSKKNQLTLAAMLLILIFFIVVSSCGGLDLSSC